MGAEVGGVQGGGVQGGGLQGGGVYPESYSRGARFREDRKIFAILVECKEEKALMIYIRYGYYQDSL